MTEEEMTVLKIVGTLIYIIMGNATYVLIRDECETTPPMSLVTVFWPIFLVTFGIGKEGRES